ncbi:coiled-coil domain-containing protein [Wolbachia endosymbiont (group B) of Apotomis turbidana]|uniref:hypothetical protein n=1 Tax=Wolbachia endosymbiont (group B) of Apotomis turbidana TaxID=2953983 RepID=UPI0022311327|nr:hypothetical protein [Wolbachia endosymbiont (group B) of Apotomis turbidana]
MANMRTKKFIKFLERERLKDVLYERLKWQKSHEEINQLFDEFGKLKIVWWMPSVAESARGKKFSQGQVIVVLLLTGAVACSLYERYRILGLLSLSFLSGYVLHSFLHFAKRIDRYTEIYHEVKVMLSQTSGSNYQNGYMQSISGMVNCAEFEYHVEYLVSMKRGEFEKYKKDVEKEYKDAFFEKKVAKEFLSYVESIRNGSNKNFKDDIAELRYSHELKEDLREWKAYNNFFTFTKSLLWKVVPQEGNKEKMIDIVYSRLKALKGSDTLEECLRKTCLLHYTGDIENLSKVIKKFFLKSHTDKSSHKKSREIFEKENSIYKALSTIIEIYEKYYFGAVFCDLKEFLGWKLEDITEKSVAEHVLSMEQPLTSGCELTLIAYNEHKKSTRGIKDKILENFRRLIEVQNELLNDDKNEELKKEKKDIEDKQKDLSEKLKSQLKELRVSYKYLKKHFSEEIERCKKTINSSEDKFIKYKNTKRIKNLKIKLEMYEREEENMENFLFKVEETEGKILLKEVRNHKLEIGGCALAAIAAGSVGIAVKLPAIALPLFFVLPFIKGFYDDYKKSNEERKERKSKETEHDYMIAYQDLCNGYDKLMEKGTTFGNFLVSVGIRHKENEKELKEKAESLKGKFKTQNETKVNVEEYLKDEKEKAKFLKKEAKEVAIRLEKAIESLNKEKVRNEMAEARVKALDLVYIKAYEFKIPMKKIIQNQDIRELLTQQYAFLVLNTDYAEKFKGICNEYRNLKEELKSKQLRLNNEQEKYVFDKEEKKHVMGKLAKLNDEIDRLSKNFVQREHKENESAEEFDDEAINELRFHVIAGTKQARKATEQERKALIEEKNAVEEIVMQLQRSDSVQTPSSAFSSVSHESVAGPSWRI